MELSQEEIKRITEYLFVKTPIKPADLCLVFGTKEDGIIDPVVSIWRQGLCKKILVSGGVNRHTGVNEAHRIVPQLITQGIDPDIILIEDKATNTGENCRFSAKIIEETIGWEEVTSVIGVGKLWLRRFLMTLEKEWPKDVDKMLTGFNPFDLPVKDWYKDPQFKQKVLLEYKKIPEYLKLGYIQEINL